MEATGYHVTIHSFQNTEHLCQQDCELAPLRVQPALWAGARAVPGPRAMAGGGGATPGGHRRPAV